MSVTLNPDDIALVDAVVKEIERRKEAWRLSGSPEALPRLREAVRRWTSESNTKASLTDEGWHKIQLIAGLYHLLPWSDQRDNRSLPGDRALASPPGREPLEWGDDAHFDIPEWEELDSSFTAQEMSRHFFIVGETGSGKSKSAVIPLLTSCLRFEADSPDSRASILLIDPKFELKTIVTDFVNARSNERDIIEFSIDDPKVYINFFSPADNNAP
ncbi:MAG: helicase HerA domain-containing protein, partial [Candidatus Baltobacteraceae bacterium]